MALQFFNSCLAVEASWLVENGVMSLAAYRSATQRGNIMIARRGCRNTPALVDYESLPDRVKSRIVALVGNPYEVMRSNALERYLAPSVEASQFFEAYVANGGRHLPAAICRQYHAEACVLNAIAAYLADKCGRASALGHRAAGGWTSLVDLVSRLDSVKWPHDLPSNPRSLERKFKAYRADGYEALVHGNYKNNQRNAARVKSDEGRALLLDLVSDPRNLHDTQVAALYNASRPASEAEITDRVVSAFRHRHAQEIHARRHGGSDFRARRLMSVKRSAPSAPLYFWTLDGWDAELLYQQTRTDKKGHSVTTYFNRVKLEVVLDACSKYPIGFAIGDVESPELVRAALRDAVNHTRELFGHRYRPAQIQMDHAGYKSLRETYERTAIHVTPAAVRNAKAKIIEPWFHSFNDRYCHLQPNWSGYGLTADKDSQPNVELLNKARHSFPGRDGVVEQLTRFINAERARLRDEFLAKWDAMPEENRFPMSDEQYLTAFGVRSASTYLLRSTGIKMTLPNTGGRTVEFDCFDHEFRRHASVHWTVVYDPADTSTALAVNADGSLQFTLERRHVQPMALIERQPGDAEALQRVRNFNKEEEQRVAAFLGSIGEASALRIDTAATADDPANAIAARDYETLGKLLIVDSDGQHKSQKDEARLRMTAPTPPPPPDFLGDILDKY